MAGIYIHIPFCKQACSYCDFHFSTSLKHKDALIRAICVEIENRAEAWRDYQFDTIYFGGGTPSIVDVKDIEIILNKLHSKFSIDSNSEVTLEGNPDDFSLKKLRDYKYLGINRLSMGVQSFFDADLQLLNRSHTANQAENAIKDAQDVGISNITIDLIYGIQGLTDQRWKDNINKALHFDIPHISAYALTVESKTVLAYQISKQVLPPVSEEQSAGQFNILIDALTANGFVHYEVSNFGKPEFFSKHNTNYWKHIPYLGLGPSAHSYTGNSRRWNVRNNATYIKQIDKQYFEEERLTKTDIYNELIMTGLRTIWGVDLLKIQKLGKQYYNYVIKQSKKYIEHKQLTIADNHLVAQSDTLFLIDGIISDLFMLNDTNFMK